MKRIGILFGFLLIATASFAQAPVAGGVVNAGSYAFAGLPNAAIAQGSLFVLFGTNMGPATLVPVASFPLQTSLGGTSVSVTVNGSTSQALMIYTSAGQVAAVLPSRTPVGTGTLTVTFNGQTSAPLPITVVQSNFGAFTLNQGGSGAAVILDGDFKAITALHPAAPGQTVALWGTGLGAISGDDSQAPAGGDMGSVPVEVFVGTAKAPVVYRGRAPGFAGVDQINFQVPNGQLGCNVSVLVKIASFVSNATTMAVSNSGPCSDPGGISADALTQLNSKGSIAIGSVTLGRTTVQTAPITLPPGVTLPPGINLSGTTTSEFAGAGFERFTRDQFLSATGATGSTVSIGGCTVSTFRSGSAVSGIVGAFTGLDAGPSIGLSGPNGQKTLTQSTNQKGIYSGALSTPTGPAYIVPGSYTFTGTGGADVQAFQAGLTVGSSLTWTNEASISSVNRTQDLPITWTGGGNGTVEIVGQSTIVAGTAVSGAGFICFANANAGQFTVPSAVLLALPAGSSQTVGGVSLPSGLLDVGTYSFSPFTAPGIDSGFAIYTDSTGKSVTFQ